MNILIIGSGGREHALAWKLAQSPKCDRLYIAPGNGGTLSPGENVDLDINNFEAIGIFCIEKTISMLVVGPEDPLVNGIYDHFSSNPILSSINVIGPSADAARLEGSKSFAKSFMDQNNIPTAAYKEFNGFTRYQGIEYLTSMNTPIVLKADGLAAGKGVLICESKDDAIKEFFSMLDGKFGTASSTIVVEDFLDGIEFSVFVLTDGDSYKILPVAKDYKRIGEGNTGLNTGGMGAVSPVPFVDKALMDKVEEQVIIPTINGLKTESLVYKGFVYIGLILVNGEPKVIEYNCRMGDPETQAVMPRLKNDLVELFDALGNGTLQDHEIEIDERTVCTIVMASGGYPGSYEKGKEIRNLDAVKGSIVFHAGTKIQDDKLYTSGGRVLAVSSFGNDIDDAVGRSLANLEKIQFDGQFYRKDIGFDLTQILH